MTTPLAVHAGCDSSASRVSSHGLVKRGWRMADPFLSDALLSDRSAAGSE
jgi:hypothetical protein